MLDFVEFKISINVCDSNRISIINTGPPWGTYLRRAGPRSDVQVLSYSVG
jgi:hypothetical protein